MDKEQVKDVAQNLNDVLQFMADDLHLLQDEMMDLEYADSGCAFYYEDDVWYIIKKHQAMLKQYIRNAETIIRYGLEDANG